MKSWAAVLLGLVLLLSLNIAQAQEEDEWDVGPILGLVFGLIAVIIIISIAICVLAAFCGVGTGCLAHYCYRKHTNRNRNVTTDVQATPEVVVATTQLPMVAYPAGGYGYSTQGQEAMPPPPYSVGYPSQPPAQTGYPPQEGYPKPEETAVSHPNKESQQPGYLPKDHPDYTQKQDRPPHEGYSC